MPPQTNLIGFKSEWYEGRCSATRPFSLIISSIPAAIVIPPFLAEKQMIMQMVFQVHNECSCFCYAEVHAFSFTLRYKVQEFQSQEHNHILSVSVLAIDKNFPFFSIAKLRFSSLNISPHQLKT
jgi:hypothetical protein